MGAAIGGELVKAGHEVGWRAAGRSAATRQRAAEFGLREFDDLVGCAAVFSICPPSAALDVAREVAGFGGLYIDANAVSPGTAAGVAEIVTAAGDRFVDGGITGIPPSDTSSPRFYLSGAAAPEIAGWFEGTRVRATALDEGGRFAASAVKMTYAAWSKIGQALALAADETARALGVSGTLHQAWAAARSDALRVLELGQRESVLKGWRWTGEMQEIARTFDECGQPGEFGRAAAEVFGRFERP
jgi:3-hydroxyisobutyrate dehydrogenase-like beta-hydroxyacid dehydrogenase